MRIPRIDKLDYIKNYSGLLREIKHRLLGRCCEELGKIMKSKLTISLTLNRAEVGSITLVDREIHFIEFYIILVIKH